MFQYVFYFWILPFTALVGLVWVTWSWLKPSRNTTPTITYPDPNANRPVLYRHRNNGWVRVNAEVFQTYNQTYHKTVAVMIPPIVAQSLFPLPINERAWIAKVNPEWCQITDPQQREAYLADHRRGLTIGSAYFGYLIPAEMVLLDELTRQYCARHFNTSSERLTFDEWLRAEPVFFENTSKTITMAYENSDPPHPDVQDAVKFYHKCEAHLEELLLFRITQHELLPSLRGVVYGSLTQLRIPMNEPLVEYYFHVALTIAVRNLRVSVPLTWIMYTPFTEEVYQLVRQELDRVTNPAPEPKKTALSLVVNNFPEPKYEF
jgi:hypothetical protein